MQICGQDFTAGLIDKIREMIKRVPDISRRVLSRQVCEWLDWRTTSGEWQEGSCRKALVSLHRQNVISLPERENPFWVEAPTSGLIEFTAPEFEGDLKELGEIEVIAVGDRRSHLSKLWKAMIEGHHYLGSGRLCGAQIRYVIRCEKVGFIGALSFNSASFALKARDEYIGWSESARRVHLNRVITNSRLVLLPGVKVANLASHVLSKALRRVARDWQEKYHIEPVLVETFVDASRFSGTSYQAANWQYAGESAGRRDGQCKDVYLYPLCKLWQPILCREPEIVLGRLFPDRETTHWAEGEFGTIRVFDERLKQRLYTIAQDFFNRPQTNIPEASGCKAKTMGAYRFFQNEKVSMDVILTPHVESTIERIREHKVVLAPQDTTTLNYVTHPGTEGFGPINNLHNSSVGLILHDTLAFTEEGTPLGVIDAQCWAREEEAQGKSKHRKSLPIEEKESVKWIRSFQKLREIQALCPQTTLISIGDRESDIYELFVEATRTPNEPKLLVRSERSRERKVDDEYLWEQLANQTPDGVLKLYLPKRGNEKARTATLALHYAKVRLTPPKGKAFDAVQLGAVYLVEIDCEADVSPIEWMLLTTVEVKDLDCAKRCVEWYAGRWGIEVYHRTLKSGCRIKDRQLGTAERIQTCLGVDMVVAWRVYYLTMLGREVPDQPCTVFFEDIEWKALCCYHWKTPELPQQPPTLAEAIRMVGKIGGHLGRKGDGMPGTECIWRGLQRLDTAVDMYAIMRSEPTPRIRKSYPHALADPRAGP
jgi:hypothetical protein